MPRLHGPYPENMCSNNAVLFAAVCGYIAYSRYGSAIREWVGLLTAAVRPRPRDERKAAEYRRTRPVHFADEVVSKTTVGSRTPAAEIRQAAVSGSSDDASGTARQATAAAVPLVADRAQSRFVPEDCGLAPSAFDGDARTGKAAIPPSSSDDASGSTHRTAAAAVPPEADRPQSEFVPDHCGLASTADRETPATAGEPDEEEAAAGRANADLKDRLGPTSPAQPSGSPITGSDRPALLNDGIPPTLSVAIPVPDDHREQVLTPQDSAIALMPVDHKGPAVCIQKSPDQHVSTSGITAAGSASQEAEFSQASRPPPSPPTPTTEQCSPVPPPPPPPPPPAGSSRLVKRRSITWKSRSSSEGTVFAKVGDAPLLKPAICASLQDLFKLQDRKNGSPKARAPTKEKNRTFLGETRARNIEILLRDVDLAQIIRAISEMNIDEIPPKLIHQLDQLLPTPEEEQAGVQILHDCNGVVDPCYRRPECFVLNLCAVDRGHERLKDCAAIPRMLEILHSIRNSQRRFTHCALALMANADLRRLLQIVLEIGNALNEGSAMQTARAFDPEVLPSLKFTKASDGRSFVKVLQELMASEFGGCGAAFAEAAAIKESISDIPTRQDSELAGVVEKASTLAKKETKPGFKAGINNLQRELETALAAQAATHKVHEQLHRFLCAPLDDERNGCAALSHLLQFMNDLR